MKTITTLCLLVIVAVSCKEKQTSEPDVNTTPESQTIDSSKYPKALLNIFNAHGGLEHWNSLENLCFELEKEGGNEVHTTSLKNRKAKIEHKDWTIGYNGKEVWLQQHSEEAYKGNARFYHNLMFYFYAMPFVLADDGITYAKVEKTQLVGNLYEGIKVSYDNGVGDSPDDEYILFYNPDTYQMEWLGYTVTYGKDGKSDRWSYIKYADWQQVNGLRLPKTLTWFTVEEGVPVEARNDREFINVTATETILEDSVFQKPIGATVVEK